MGEFYELYRERSGAYGPKEYQAPTDQTSQSLLAMKESSDRMSSKTSIQTCDPIGSSPNDKLEQGT